MGNEQLVSSLVGGLAKRADAREFVKTIPFSDKLPERQSLALVESMQARGASSEEIMAKVRLTALGNELCEVLLNRIRTTKSRDNDFVEQIFKIAGKEAPLRDDDISAAYLRKVDLALRYNYTHAFFKAEPLLAQATAMHIETELETYHDALKPKSQHDEKKFPMYYRLLVWRENAIDAETSMKLLESHGGALPKAKIIQLYACMGGNHMLHGKEPRFGSMQDAIDCYLGVLNDCNRLFGAAGYMTWAKTAAGLVIGRTYLSPKEALDARAKIDSDFKNLAKLHKKDLHTLALLSNWENRIKSSTFQKLDKTVYDAFERLCGILSDSKSSGTNRKPQIIRHAYSSKTSFSDAEECYRRMEDELDRTCTGRLLEIKGTLLAGAYLSGNISKSVLAAEKLISVGDAEFTGALEKYKCMAFQEVKTRHKYTDMLDAKENLLRIIAEAGKKTEGDPWLVSRRPAIIHAVFRKDCTSVDSAILGLKECRRKAESTLGKDKETANMVEAAITLLFYGRFSSAKAIKKTYVEALRGIEEYASGLKNPERDALLDYKRVIARLSLYDKKKYPTALPACELLVENYREFGTLLEDRPSLEKILAYTALRFGMTALEIFDKYISIENKVLVFCGKRRFAESIAMKVLDARLSLDDAKFFHAKYLKYAGALKIKASDVPKPPVLDGLEPAAAFNALVPYMKKISNNYYHSGLGNEDAFQVASLSAWMQLSAGERDVDCILKQAQADVFYEAREWKRKSYLYDDNRDYSPEKRAVKRR